MVALAVRPLTIDRILTPPVPHGTNLLITARTQTGFRKGPAMNADNTMPLAQPAATGPRTDVAPAFSCESCVLGPCRVVDDKSAGACGATRDLIVSRAVLRTTASGASARCSHANRLLESGSTFSGKTPPGNFIKRRAPKGLFTKWKQLGILPRFKRNSHLVEIAEALEASTLGADADYTGLLNRCLRLGLVDGYYGMYLATELEDKKLGRPRARTSNVGLGCIGSEKANIVIHAHDSRLVKVLAKEAARRKQKDVAVIGICSAGDLRMSRHGIPLAAHHGREQELIDTGAVEVLVVDSGSIMPSVAERCASHHTKLVTTNDNVRLPGADHKPVHNGSSAKKAARAIIQLALENRANRRSGAEQLLAGLPKEPQKAVVGHTQHNVPVKQLAQELADGKRKGVIVVTGCVDPRVDMGQWVTMYQQLSAEYLILTTGCMGFELAQAGLVDGKNVLHMGSCANSVRVLEVVKALAKRMKVPVGELPLVFSMPAPLTEAALSSTMFYAAAGYTVHLGSYPLLADTQVANALADTLKNAFGTRLILDGSPASCAEQLKAALPDVPIPGAPAVNEPVVNAPKISKKKRRITVECVLSFTITDPANQQPVKGDGKIQDISPGNLSFVAQQQLPVSAPIALSVFVDDTLFSPTGQIAYVKEADGGFEVGVALQTDNKEATELIKQLSALEDARDKQFDL
ncbi:MAG: hypothetical protein GF331_13415 [Chitinivibrionales bacterium]|nr:hypothetical protein [Chitinivibrionales bacterium]